MSKRTIPAKTIYICDHCKREDTKGTAGDGWFHHYSEHGISPHQFAICDLCLPKFKLFLNMS